MSILYPSRRGLIKGTAGAAATSLVGKSAFAQDTVKAGFVYVGPIGDYGWTHGHHLGLEAVNEAFGDAVETTYVESVEEGTSEGVIRQLAAAGNDIIFTTSFGYMEPTLKVAPQFPDVKFEHATGYKTAPNMSAYNAKFHEGRAVCGTIAGHLSKTGVLGYVASFPIPEVVMGINALTLAAQRINPDITTKVVWVNSWYDPGLEGDAAKALIDQGVDIVSQHTDSPAPLQVAEQRGVLGFGQASDMVQFAPAAQLTSILDIWGPYYVQRVQDVIDGTWQSHSVWQGLKEGLVAMAPYSEAVPENVRADADAVHDGIIDGSFHPFTGPIKNQAGEVVVPEGETMSDADLAVMDWYVEGVEA
ncbi:MAG: BMP family ABC transporter substrate-binding protein [Pseudomonadota bacterium]